MTNEQKDIISKQYTKSETITFEDLDYIRQHLISLRHFDKNQALTHYLKQIEEPQKITNLRTTQAENIQKLEKYLQRLKSVEGAIANKQFQIDQEIAWLDHVSSFRTHLLSYLPRCYHKEGEIFLNKFIMENHNEEYKEVATPPQTHHPEPNTNYVPGMNPQKQNLQEKARRIYYSQQIQKFYDEFLQTNSEYKEFEPRFDITRPIEKIKKEILEKYDTDNLQQERERINKEIKRLSLENEDLAQTINQTQATLALKRDEFTTYYDKQILTTDYNDEIINEALLNGQINGTEEQKQYLSHLLNIICEYSEVGRYIIHQSLKSGTQYIVVPQNNIQQTLSTYINGTITLPDLSSSPHKSNLLITRIIYESKHALQAPQNTNDTISGLTNILLQKCLTESDALACTCAVSHDIKNIYPEVYNTLLSKAPYMQRAYSQTLSKNNDILKALNAAALAWDKDFGEYCKRTLSSKPFIQNTQDTPQTNDILTPEDIIQTYHLDIFETPYLDLNKAVQQALTVTDDIYTRMSILNELPSSTSEHNGMAYINRQIQRITNKKDKYGLKISEAKVIPSNKRFNIAHKKVKPYPYPNLPIRTSSFAEKLNNLITSAPHLEEIQEYILHKEIIFTETRGLTLKQIPVAALYNTGNNSIIINKSFTKDEQILAVAEIILSQEGTLLPPEFKIKSQLTYTNLSQAEQITKLFEIGQELQNSHPLILKKLKHDYPNIETNTPDKIFISALKNTTIRQKALNYLEREIPQNHPEEATQVLTIAPTEIVKLFAENLPLSEHIDYIAQISTTITQDDLKYLRNIAAYWQDCSISKITITDAYEEL